MTKETVNNNPNFAQSHEGQATQSTSMTSEAFGEDGSSFVVAIY
jgi:hypothetical protein